MRATFLILITLLFCTPLFAQMKDDGHVQIIQDSRVDTLMKIFEEKNEMHPTISGSRVEIFFEAGNYSKQKAMEAKSGFVQKYTEVPSYLIFHQPYYKVRVGDFRTKMEAQAFLKEIEKDYPNAFVVPDEINFPGLD